ncbi:type II secretion system F family protein [Litoribrevibacter euphylliae]|uniref:Type II secretion system F family protein n=1 Tax=Litoribrevibacter euphylliae TaxID=1834034 RepID=A0ABV7HHZ4_9GAMM
MAKFSYLGRNQQGDKVEGVIEASSVDAAAGMLQSQQLTPVRIEETVEESSNHIDLKQFLPKPKVKLDDLSMFCRQMYALTRSGMPIVQAIRGLADTSKNERMAEVLNQIASELVTGNSLAVSMRHHGDVFSHIFVSMVHVGESTGKLDDAFKKLIDHIELERETRSRVKQAIRYPASVVIAITVAMFIINLFVIPQFSKVFSKLGADLPLPTVILMATSEFSVQYWWVILLVMLATFFGFRYYIKTDDGELWWDRIKLKLPLMGKIFEKVALSRFARSFAMMSESGVPILQSLNIIGASIGNRYIANAVADMRRGIERGDSLARTSAASGMFTPLILQMIAVGEETGSVDKLLHDVADFYEEEVDYDLKMLSQAIEPILLVFMGIMVVVLALGVFLPMWELSSAMKR